MKLKEERANRLDYSLVAAHVVSLGIWLSQKSEMHAYLINRRAEEGEFGL